MSLKEKQWVLPLELQYLHDLEKLIRSGDDIEEIISDSKVLFYRFLHIFLKKIRYAKIEETKDETSAKLRNERKGN